MSDKTRLDELTSAVTTAVNVMQRRGATGHEIVVALMFNAAAVALKDGADAEAFSQAARRAFEKTANANRS